MRAELVIQSGKHQGKRIGLADKECLIGRHEDCKIRIASTDVSKHHCRLTPQAEGILIQDLGSSNGTFVNDELIADEVLLKPGDHLRVGPMAFLVAEEKAAAPGKKSSAAKAGDRGRASDDEIASWLTEGGDQANSGEDTTVVVPSSTPGAAPDGPTRVTTAVGEESTVPTQRGKSIKDEAGEIIRRWHQLRGKG